MASSPTQRADYYFAKAKTSISATLANADDDASIPMGLRSCLEDTIEGMSQLSAGLRATYKLLADVQKSLDDIKKAQQSPTRTARL
jgi:hypothetical protein